MFKLGIENLNNHLDLFENKNVALITNPTGVDQQFKSSIEILREKTNLKVLFAPEHGVRGNLEAGVRLDNYIDDETGIPVYSLYGNNKKPTKEMLDDIDIICFDIQDVGARFYTYIYTMAYSMIAAKEQGITFVVFDRPNPLGHDIEGSILDLKYRSFVGYYEILERYGLTIGELANLFNKEFEINCNLHVIKMKDYYYDKKYSDYNLPWIAPSPNLPTFDSCFYYLATCIFEGTNVSEGRGTTRPFKMFGAPWLDSKKLLLSLQELNLEGVSFRGCYFTPSFSKHQNMMCNGIEIYILNKDTFKPVRFSRIIVDLIRKQNKEFMFNPPYKEGLNPMINLLTGNEDVKLNVSLTKIFAKMTNDEKTFDLIRKGYYLYE